MIGLSSEDNGCGGMPSLSSRTRSISRDAAGPPSLPSSAKIDYSTSRGRKNLVGIEEDAPPLTVLPSPSAGIHGDALDHDEQRPVIVLEESRSCPSPNPCGEYPVHRYLRGRLLGKGGFAKVYECISLETKEVYAMKVIPKANAKTRDKVKNEVNIHRQLQHPNICAYKHSFEDSDNHYILLELCEDLSMDGHLQKRGRLTEPECLYYFLQMVEGVTYLHSENVIHGDLKLGNLFFTNELKIKIGDLGLATKLSNPEDRRMTLCGTPNYVAPEIIKVGNVEKGHSFEVDIWSMGVILYTLLVGKPPFESTTVGMIYRRIMQIQYSFPPDIDISPSAKDLIEKMLRYDPGERISLGEIQKHDFLTRFRTNLPDSLPLGCRTSEPRWEVDVDDGALCPTFGEEPALIKSDDHSRREIPGIQCPRQPLSSMDQNRQEGESTKQRDLAVTEKCRGKGKHRFLPSCFLCCPGGTNRERASVSPPTMRDVQQGNFQPVAKCSKEEGKSPRNYPGSSRVRRRRGASFSERHEDHNYTPVQLIYSRLANGLKALGNQDFFWGDPILPQVSDGSDKVWVTRYVDYTSKYGLGFLLNDGSAGVYFNDSTEAVLEPNGQVFRYIEPAGYVPLSPRDRQGTFRNGQEDNVDSRSMKHPHKLEKKASLLQLFCDYLLSKESSTREAQVSRSLSSEEEENDDGGFIYLKQWVRARHAILFRLSNSMVQVMFFDGTEILLSSLGNMVTYVDRAGQRYTNSLNHILLDSSTDVLDRLSYSRDMLHKLLTGRRRAYL